MIKFNKPENLNGAELLTELTNAGVEIQELPYIDGNGDFWLDVKESDKAQTITIVAAHNGTTVAPEPTVADKLANAGLTVEDLRAALGL
jgi:poly-gamma-glutamate capsule biosynthesis protein CapA/YwtB (metallophosphatase superfamily)